MESAVLTEPTVTRGPAFKARVAGIFYLLVFVTGSFALMSVRGRIPANLVATACYVVVVLLFHDLFKAVNPRVSLIAAVLGLVGCAWGALSSFEIVPLGIHNFVWFGFYCLSIGYLILRSTFLPRVLGALMMFAGLGWLTALSPLLAKSLAPYNLVPGIVGEAALTLWLIAKSVDERRWREQAAGWRSPR